MNTSLRIVMLLFKIINNQHKIIKRLKKMSQIAIKAQEVADEQLLILTEANTYADGIVSFITGLKDQIVALTTENQQLQNQLANIGSPEEIPVIFAPLKTEEEVLREKLGSIEL
jgi:hypothetical protein